MSNNVGKVTVKMTGVKELVDKFGKLGERLARRSVRRALNKVGDFWVEEVKSRTPVLLGDLRDSIAKEVSTKVDRQHPGEMGGTVTVGPELHARRTDGKKSVGPGIYGMFVEFGLKEKQYPREPFMRPTFDATSEQVEQIFREVLKEELEEVVRSLS